MILAGSILGLINRANSPATFWRREGTNWDMDPTTHRERRPACLKPPRIVVMRSI